MRRLSRTGPRCFYEHSPKVGEGKPYPCWARPPDYRCRWRAARLAAPAADTPPPRIGHYEVILAEEEISDVSLATFYVFDKEDTATFRPNIQLAMADAAVAVVVAAAVADAEAAAAVAVEVAVAVEAAEDAAAFGPTGAAGVAWCVQDVQ